MDKTRYPAAAALAVARELCAVLTPLCEPDRIKVCGSLRRRKPEVGDVEIVFVPRMRLVSPEERDLFGNVQRQAVTVPATHAVLDDLVTRRDLCRRPKSDGTFTWGKWNRLAVHGVSGIPVDFFACTEEGWWNTVVCRTGGAESNTAICVAAIAKGWHWEPSPERAGFQRASGLGKERHPVASEREVFDFVGLPFLEPWDRK